ncbi:MAG: pilus assembly protein TadG-related protein [Ilumatobacter sp.]|uniref:pilus assembly protein TadG-related protein n=1 Tax=Ilumatobacter sp. TaxID=1967498 RepID=UPI003C756B0E
MSRRTRSQTEASERDRGETMLMTTVLIGFLLIGSWALISGSQQWGARRDTQAVASAAARAGAQVSEAELRGGSVMIDPSLASQRANAVLSASGYAGGVSVNGLTVTVTATGSVDYAFPSPGFPSSLTSSATSSAVRGVQGDEGG